MSDLSQQQRDDLAGALRGRIGKTRLDAYACVDALAPLVTRWVAEARAEGWDEGWDERDKDCSEPHSPPRRNPYRADPTEEQR